MSEQLTLNLKPQCSECGESFNEEELNHYDLCEDCCDILETLADLKAEVAEKRMSRLPQDPQVVGYEGELMGVPGSSRHRALEAFYKSTKS